MTGRVYLDWNATAPLRDEARAAMLAAMDAGGNPSSVHAEGRAARAIVEKARLQVARLVDCDPEQIVFTSGATEANNMAIRSAGVAYAPTDHASVVSAAEALAQKAVPLPVGADGRIAMSSAALAATLDDIASIPGRRVVAIAAANGETGVVETTAPVFGAAAARGLAGHCDATQAVGRVAFSARGCGAETVALSAHKIGGPKGVGALVFPAACTVADCGPERLFVGGAQERHRRAGTENVAGIAGFGAAAAAALAERDSGLWQEVARRRDALEARIADAAPDTIFVGRGAPRLPNTTCFALPGWAAEMQVMQLDLAGFAISAGAACSSGKVRPSHVLIALGYDDDTARSAIRVSLGPTTRDADIERFCTAWIGLYRNRRLRAA